MKSFLVRQALIGLYIISAAGSAYSEKAGDKLEFQEDFRSSITKKSQTASHDFLSIYGRWEAAGITKPDKYENNREYSARVSEISQSIGLSVEETLIYQQTAGIFGDWCTRSRFNAESEAWEAECRIESHKIISQNFRSGSQSESLSAFCASFGSWKTTKAIPKPFSRFAEWVDLNEKYKTPVNIKKREPMSAYVELCVNADSLDEDRDLRFTIRAPMSRKDAPVGEFSQRIVLELRPKLPLILFFGEARNSYYKQLLLTDIVRLNYVVFGAEPSYPSKRQYFVVAPYVFSGGEFRPEKVYEVIVQ